MAMLAEVVELVIGVDTHKHTHTAAVVAAATGAVVTQATVPTTPAGYQQLLQVAGRHPGQRVWAIESTGGYGAGLTRFLAAHQEQVWSWTGPSELPAATAPSPTPWTPPGRPARPWPASNSPSPERPAIARRWRCGWRRAAPRSRRPPTPNDSCMRWSSLPLTPSAAGCVA
jgi:Transposase